MRFWLEKQLFLYRNHDVEWWRSVILPYLRQTDQFIYYVLPYKEPIDFYTFFRLKLP